MITNASRLFRVSLFRASLGAACLLLPVALHAQLYLSSGHVDLNVGHSPAPGPGFGLYAHHVSALFGGTTRDEPIDHTVFFVPDTGGRFPTAGGLLPFLGQSGQPVWLIPQNNPPATVPWVGVGGYGLGGTDGSPSTELDVFDPLPELTGNDVVPAVRVRFVGALTPPGADFALWQTGSGGSINLFFSNRPGTTAPQLFGLRRGQHIHFNWGFSQPGYYRVRLRLEGRIGGSEVAPRDFNVDFAISTLPLYEQWRRAGGRFTELERVTRAIGGQQADPDADGRPNLLEYAFGAEPRLADTAPGAPRVALSGATPALEFTRLADPLFVYRVESSTTLSSWTEIWSSTGPANVAGPVSVPAPAPLSPSAPRSFLRLRASLVE